MPGLFAIRHALHVATTLGESWFPWDW